MSQYLTGSQTQNASIDDNAKDGGPGEVWLLCSFYHEPLQTLIKTNVNKFAIWSHTAFKLEKRAWETGSEKLLEADLWIWAWYITKYKS